MKGKYEQLLEECKSLFYLNGYFFLRSTTLKKNDVLVKRLLKDMYKVVNYN